MKLRRIQASFRKQMMDTGYIRSILIQFLIYPVFILLFSYGKAQEASGIKMMIVSVMSSMFIGISPMMMINSIMREDKASGALKTLMLSSVRPMEYMIGSSLFLFLTSVVTSVLIGLIGGFPGVKLFFFILLMMLGSILTIIVGCAIALGGGSQANATLIIITLSMMNGMLPLLEIFYPAIGNVTRFWYTEQIKRMISSLYTGALKELSTGFQIIFANLFVFIVLMILMYRKSRMFEEK